MPGLLYLISLSLRFNFSDSIFAGFPAMRNYEILTIRVVVRVSGRYEPSSRFPRQTRGRDGGCLKSARPSEARREHRASTHLNARKNSFRDGAGDPERPSHRVHRGASAGRPALPSVQPVSPWHSPHRCAVGAIKGSTRNSIYLRSLFRAVGSINAADSDRQPPNSSGYRI